MEIRSEFDIPLETLTRSGVHEFSFDLNDAFFASFESGLLAAGEFTATVEIERIRNQYNLRIQAKGKGVVECDRCLDPFPLPLDVDEEMVIKYDSDKPREEVEVIYVPIGSEFFNVSKLIYDFIGVSLPMSRVHEDAGLECNPKMVQYLVASQPEPTIEEDEDKQDLPEDSPWNALRDFKDSENN
ncbi:MAG: DUF177 domain-containing protein [Saprospiraceae bacterium]